MQKLNLNNQLTINPLRRPLLQNSNTEERPYKLTINPDPNPDPIIRMGRNPDQPPQSPKRPGAKRRVMVVADPTRESAGALQYTLDHAMHNKDDLILIHVTNIHAKKPSIRSFLRRHSDPLVDAAATLLAAFDGNDGESDGKDIDFLAIMKKACEATHPNSKVWIEKVDIGSLDKGGAILAKCKLLSVDLLVVGQRRHISSVILGPRRSTNVVALGGGSKTIDTAEFLIENSPCTCVAVQKKGQNAGYLLNSKTHKNFWLLA